MLDASQSRDEDIPPYKPQRLTYLWSCLQSNFEKFGQDCTDALFRKNLNNGPIITIPANVMNITDKYTVTVHVSSKDGRTSKASIALQPSPPLSPIVSIFNAKTRVNVDAKLSFTGYITANFSISAFWSVYVDTLSTVDSLPVSISPITPRSLDFSSSAARSKVHQN